MSCLGYILEDVGCASHDAFQTFNTLCETLIKCKKVAEKTDDDGLKQRYISLAVYTVYAMRYAFK